jgi:uncharacterized protein (TIGR02284 family)
MPSGRISIRLTSQLTNWGKIKMINDYEATKPMTESPESTTISNDDVISTLNGLIETCKDGQEGFKQSAEGVTDSNLKSLFYELGQQRSQFAGELQTLVREMGGDPENSGSTAGALHRGWINIKAAVTGKDEGAILNEAERGEDVAKKAYKDALETNLPANAVSVVQEQYAQVQTAHDKVRDLRDSVNNNAASAS